jgi:hypothetical protein
MHTDEFLRNYSHENNVAITGVGDVGKMDVLEYLAALARKGLSGVARARKVSAIREYFRFLEGVGVIQKSPTAGIDTLPIRPINSYYREFPATRRETPSTPAVAGCPLVTLTRVSADAGFPGHRHA